METVQTVLNGADVYFWFIEGFGDVDRLKDSHFAPIDIPIIHAVISFIVQLYFCYRIWILNKRRSSWFCVIICIVRLRFSFTPSGLTLVIALRLPRFKPSGAPGAGYRQGHATRLKRLTPDVWF